MKKCYCKDCGRKLAKSAYRSKSKRCHSCAAKRNYKLGILNNKGKNNPMFEVHRFGEKNPNHKYGNYCIDHYCKCGNKISTMTFIYGRGKCYSCAKIGNLNTRWLGGISKLPYAFEFTKELKESIRKRDNYICQKCYRKGTHIHHINYDKQNCAGDNLITLCNSCNIKANFNRDYWYAYFTYIMEEKNGK